MSTRHQREGAVKGLDEKQKERACKLVRGRERTVRAGRARQSECKGQVRGGVARRYAIGADEKPRHETPTCRPAAEVARDFD